MAFDPEQLTNEELIGILKRRGITPLEAFELFQDPENKKKIVGELDIQSYAGTIYLHNPRGQTLLRLSNLPKPIPKLREIPEKMLDITYGVGVNYSTGNRE